MLNIILTTTFLGILLLGGYLYSESLFPSKLIKSRLGASILLGNILFVLAFRFLYAQGPWFSAFSVCAFGGLVYIVARMFGGRQRSEVLSQRIETIDILLLLGIGALYFLQVWHTVGYDDLFHFHTASQIIRGKFPPSFHAFTDLPVKYHYGWATLVAAISTTGQLNLPISSDILTLYSLIGCILLVISLFELLGCSQKAKIIGTSIFFLGGGIFYITHFLLYGSIRNGLCTLSMFQQHTTVYGFGIFLLTVNFIAIYGMKYGKSRWWSLPFAVIPVIAVPIINATSAPFLLMTLLAMGSIMFIRQKTLRARLTVAIASIMLISFIFLAWINIGGAMTIGDSHENPAFGLSIQVFGLSAYAKYMTAYFLLLAPYGLIACLASIVVIAKKRSSIIYENPVIILLLCSCTVLYLLPAVFMLKNIAYWDNFCKLNYFGVLAGWIMLIYFADTKDLLLRLRRLHKLIFAILLVIACHESVLTVAKALTSNAYQEYKAEVKSKQQLIDLVKEDVPINSTILLLNKELTEFYDVSRETHRPNVNYLTFCYEYYGDFTIIAQETGASIVNLFHFHSSHDNTRKFHLLDVLKGLTAGDGRMLQEWDLDYVLCMIEKCPTFLDKWEKDGLVEPFKENQDEGWSLYKVSRTD